MPLRILEQLQDALEKGDVLELETAIAAAQQAIQQNRTHSGASHASHMSKLLAEATVAYVDHVAACAPYLKPLRRACKELSERAIFDALLSVRSAPESIQLYMYSDIRKAEDMRTTMVQAHKDALEILETDDWVVLDEFLTEKASILPDRTILALVQKREELLKAERHAGVPRGPRLISPHFHSFSRQMDSDAFNVHRTSPSAASPQVALQQSPRALIRHTTYTPLQQRFEQSWMRCARLPIAEVSPAEGLARAKLLASEEVDRARLYKNAMRGVTELWAATILLPERGRVDRDVGTVSDRPETDFSQESTEAPPVRHRQTSPRRSTSQQRHAVGALSVPRIDQAAPGTQAGHPSKWSGYTPTVSPIRMTSRTTELSIDGDAQMPNAVSPQRRAVVRLSVESTGTVPLLCSIERSEPQVVCRLYTRLQSTVEEEDL